jgi:mannose-6-phosphate isomerase-like protein (cupin superfamily)
MEIDVKIKHPKKVIKTWGHELWIHNTPEYCGKLLVFEKSGNNFSMHYHIKKKETWYIQEGKFRFDWIDVENGKRNYTELLPNDVIEIERGLPHQLTALTDGAIVFEVSTEHFDEDSYRVYRNTPKDLE